jgi:hypothetical protein
MPPEGYYERRMLSDLSHGILEKSNLIPVDLDSLSSKGKMRTFESFRLQMELKAAKEERFEDAIKWRDLTKTGTVYLLSDDEINGFNVCDNPFGEINF